MSKSLGCFSRRSRAFLRVATPVVLATALPLSAIARADTSPAPSPTPTAPRSTTTAPPTVPAQPATTLPAVTCRHYEWPGAVERAGALMRPLRVLIQTDQRSFERIDGDLEHVNLAHERAVTASVRSGIAELRDCVGPGIDTGPAPCQWLQGNDKEACMTAPPCQWVPDQNKGACLAAPPGTQAQMETQSLLQPNTCALVGAKRAVQRASGSRGGPLYDDTGNACHRAANRARAAQIAEFQHERACDHCAQTAAQWQSAIAPALAWADGRDADLDKEDACRASAQCANERVRAAAEKSRREVIERAEANLKEILDNLCRDIAVKRDAHATIARENSNPSGVRDLAALHEAGADIQDMDRESAAQDVVCGADRAARDDNQEAFHGGAVQGAMTHAPR